MKRGTAEHPKTKALARALQIPLPFAVGLLEMLWHFTADYCPTGAVGRFSDDEIAEACGWPIDRPAEELITALLGGPEGGRWLDLNEEHRLLIHDWPDHTDDAVHRKLARAGELFADGTPPSTRRLGEKERAVADKALKEKVAERAQNVRPHVRPTPPGPASAPPVPRQSPAPPEPRPAPPVPCPASERASSPATVPHPVAGAREGSDPPARSIEPTEPKLDPLEAVARTAAAVLGKPVPADDQLLGRIVSRAAALNAHPGLLCAWIATQAERSASRGSPVETLGFFSAVLDAELPAFVDGFRDPITRALREPGWEPVESVTCGRCEGAMTRFADGTVVGCLCRLPRSRGMQRVGAIAV